MTLSHNIKWPPRSLSQQPNLIRPKPRNNPPILHHPFSAHNHQIHLPHSIPHRALRNSSNGHALCPQTRHHSFTLTNPRPIHHINNLKPHTPTTRARLGRFPKKRPHNPTPPMRKHSTSIPNKMTSIRSNPLPPGFGSADK